MEENKLNNITVNPVDPTTFEYQEYSEQDNNLISSFPFRYIFKNIWSKKL